MPDRPEAFVDTNVLLYLLSSETRKADQAEAVLRAGCLISVQVLNEMANVARRKAGMSWREVNAVLGLIRSVCRVEPLTIETHGMGRALAEKYQLSVYDSMIVAAAMLAGCKTLYSEDMQHGMLVNDQLRIRNPFAAVAGPEG